MFGFKWLGFDRVWEFALHLDVFRTPDTQDMLTFMFSSGKSRIQNLPGFHTLGYLLLLFHSLGKVGCTIILPALFVVVEKS